MNPVYLLTLFLLFFTTHLTASTSYLVEDKASTPLLSPSFSEQKTAKLRLENGLEIYLVSNPRFDKSGASLTINVGSWEDPKEHPGMAHFLEHMLFLGTEEYPEEAEFDRFFAEHGGTFNAFTSNHYTGYLFSIDTDALGEGLKHFSSFFKTPLFNPSGVARELQAIDQEYAKNIENDDIRLLYVHKYLAKPDHPYHGFNMGNSKTLKHVKREELLKWYREHYSANLMRLVVLSSLPIDQLQEMAIAAFKGVPSNNREPFVTDIAITQEAMEGRLIYIEPLKDMRRLTFIWELPSHFVKMRANKPEAVVCHVLGHEGENSLLNQLKKQHLAEGLSCGGFKIGADAMLFYLEITLTKQGLHEIESIAEQTFQAINNFKEKGTPSYLANELKQMARMEYQYQSLDDIFRSMMKHARLSVDEALETYPEQSLLIKEDDPQAVVSLLEALKPETAQLFILAPSDATGIQPDKREPWIGVDFAVREVPDKMMQTWKNAKPTHAIALPKENPYIPEQLTQHTHKTANSPLIPTPTLILDSPVAQVYFAQDDRYHLPKVTWNIQIKTPLIQVGNATSLVLGDLYVQALKEKLNAMAYPAQLAGLGYGITRKDNGIEIEISGYSDKAPVLFQDILKQLKDAIPTMQAFQTYRDTLLRKYENFAKETPLKQSLQALKQVLYRTFTTEKEKASAVKKVSFKKYKEFAETLFNEAYIEAFFYGNMTQQEAKKQSQELVSTLQAEPYPKEKQYRKEVVVLPEENGPFFLTKQTQSQGNAVVLLVEEPIFSFKREAAQDILMQAIKEPFFSTLRTKQQTGYIVVSAAEEVKEKLFNIFAVQSNTHEGRDLLARFELFIEQFLQEMPLSELPEERFDLIRNALMKQKQQPPKNIDQMGELLNTLAFEREGDFSWINKQIEGFQTLTYQEFLGYAKEFLGRNNKRRLGILVQGEIPEEHLFQYTPVKNLQTLRNKYFDYTDAGS